MSSPLLGTELVDQGENIAVILGEQAAEVLAAFRLGTAFGHYSRRGEVLVNLPVQFLPVGDHHKGPVARYLAQHLLGEENHRDALAAALGMPEHAQFASRCRMSARASSALLTPRYWWFFAVSLINSARDFLKQGEVLHQIQQSRRFADAAQHGLQ